MSKAEIKIEGKEKLLANLKKWQFLKAQKIAENDLATAHLIRNDALDLVPVDTGRLKGSISIVERDGVGVLANTNYAVFIEFGTDRMPAQPYLNPALEMNRKGYFRRIKEIMRKRGF